MKAVGKKSVAAAANNLQPKAAHPRKAVTNSHELQAERAAHAFVRGEKDLSRLLTPAATAGFSLPTSRGETLPLALRLELEQSFGADLSAVRIHQDAPAAAMAAELGAHAFVGGADIYFAADRFTSGGTALLAHEIAHVLQQTGRRSSDGRLSAVNRLGCGAVQLDQDRDLPRLFSTTQSLSVLADRHAAVADTPQLAAEIRAQETVLRDLLGNELNADNPTAQTLAERADNGEWDNEPEAVLAFLTDVLRAMRISETVAGILFVNPNLKCLLHDSGTQFFGVETVGPGWLSGQLSREPLNRWFPSRFVETFRVYLFAPRRAIQALSDDDPAYGNIVDWERRYLADVHEHGETLAENELFFLALDFLRIANDERIELLRQLEASPSVAGAPSYIKRLFVAHELVTVMDSTGSGESATGTLVLWRLVASEIRVIAQRAEALWTEVRNAIVERSGSELLRSQAQSPVAERFHSELGAFADTVFARSSSGRLPSAQIYQANLRRATTRLRTYAQSDLEGALIRLTRRSDDAYDPALAAWYGLVLAVLPELFQTIDSYQYRDDLAVQRRFGVTDNLDRQWGADLRIQHRLALAAKIRPIVQTMQWQDLIDLIDAVLQASDEGASETELAILDDWQEQSGLHIADFASGEDGLGFEADTPIRGLVFLTPRQLANVYLSEYFSRAGDAVQAILEGDATTPGEEGNVDSDRPTIASRVRPIIDAIPRPRRYLLAAEKYRLARNPQDPLPVYQLVMAHPRTQQFMESNGIYLGVSQVAVGDLAVFPVRDPYEGGSLFFWSLPSLEPVVTRLRRITELDLLVRLAMAAPDQSIDPSLIDTVVEPEPVVEDVLASGPEGPFWFRWLNAFATMDSAATDRYAEAFGNVTQEEESQAALRHMRLWRRAWIQDRQLLIRYRVRPLLETYRSIGVDTYNQPVMALERLYEFSTWVYPEGDASQHLTLALLELFRPPTAGENDFSEELSRSGRYDLIVTWQAALRRAIRYAGPDLRVLLLDLMTDAERRDLSWLDAALARMRSVEQAMERAKAQAQLLTGFLVRPQGEEDAAHPAFIALPGTRELSAAEPFTINGIVYQLLNAAHTVEFHPDWGTRSDLDSYRPSQLIVDGVPVEADPETRTRNGTRELFRITRNGRMIVVRESDDELLEELSNAIGMQSVVRSLEELEVFIEWAMNLTLDALEFVPGAGQALMAARLATSILAFIASPEFDEIREQVLEDPTGFIEGLAELVAGELFEPDRFIGWVLLSGLVPTAIGSVRNPRPSRLRTPRSGGRGSAIARFAQVMARLTQVGVRFGRSVNRMRQRAGQTFISLESYVQGHPVLALAFEIIGEFADFLDRDVIREAQGMLERAGAVEAEIETAFGRFPEHLGELVAGFNSFEIPRSIIPMNQVLSILIDLVIERLGSKYRLAGRGILFVLEQLGLKQQILDAIVAQLPEEANPNSYWEEFVDDTLQPRLDTIRIELIAGLNELLQQFGVPHIPEATGSEHRVVPHGDEFPEAAGHSIESRSSSGGASPVPPGPGQPLPTGLRFAMESGFGHDFSHVRLHTGGEAERTTVAFGADALATGSHVYLANSVSPAGEGGRKVLRHELAHVLQQTGPRPLTSGGYASTPQLPAARGGVRYHSGAERAADAMAARAAQRRGGSPVSVLGSRVAGWQPALSAGTVGRIIRRLSRGEALIQHYQRLDPEHGGSLPAVETLPEGLSAQVANVHTGIRDAIRSMTGWPGGFGDDLQEKVRSYYIGGNRVEDLRHAVNRIVRESLVLHRPVGAIMTGGSSTPAPEPRFSVRLFERGMEAYFLERGLGMRIAFNTETRENWSYLQAGTPIRSLSFAFLNMARIGSGSDLWEVLMSANWPTATRGSDLWRRYQPRVRAYLEARGPVVRLYRSGLIFTHSVQEEIEELASEATEIDLAHLPSKAEYINASGAGAQNRGSGVLSLAVGRYGDANQTGADRGKERESHHTTQFLLLEYFSNWHAMLKPFQHDLALFEPVGLTLESGQPNEFRPTSGSSIKIKALAGSSKSARGPQMPTISVARLTHRRGRLHIQAVKPNTPGDESSTTQSLAVHMKFRAFVSPTPVHDALFGTQGQFSAFTANSHGRQQMRDGIYQAMRATYRWMRDDMSARLRNGLRSVEVDYYNALAEQAGRSERMTPDEVTPAMTNAEQNNSRIMENENHWG